MLLNLRNNYSRTPFRLIHVIFYFDKSVGRRTDFAKYILYNLQTASRLHISNLKTLFSALPFIINLFFIRFSFS